MKTAISRTKTKKNGKAKSKTPATDRLLAKATNYILYRPKR